MKQKKFVKYIPNSFHRVPLGKVCLELDRFDVQSGKHFFKNTSSDKRPSLTFTHRTEGMGTSRWHSG